jgi:hypothetical protein
VRIEKHMHILVAGYLSEALEPFISCLISGHKSTFIHHPSLRSVGPSGVKQRPPS